MIIGEFESKVGGKNRIAIPKKFREELGEKGLVITRGYEKSLILVDQVRWKKLIKSIEVRPLLNANVRDLKRYLVGGALEVEIDSQGRFVLSSILKSFSEINNEVVFVGIEDWIEIWDKERWKEKIKNISENVADLAERLSEIK